MNWPVFSWHVFGNYILIGRRCGNTRWEIGPTSPKVPFLQRHLHTEAAVGPPARTLHAGGGRHQGHASVKIGSWGEHASHSIWIPQSRRIRSSFKIKVIERFSKYSCYPFEGWGTWSFVCFVIVFPVSLESCVWSTSALKDWVNELWVTSRVFANQTTSIKKLSIGTKHARLNMQSANTSFILKRRSRKNNFYFWLT